MVVQLLGPIILERLGMDHRDVVTLHGVLDDDLPVDRMFGRPDVNVPAMCEELPELVRECPQGLLKGRSLLREVDEHEGAALFDAIAWHAEVVCLKATKRPAVGKMTQAARFVVLPTVNLTPKAAVVAQAVGDHLRMAVSAHVAEGRECPLLVDDDNRLSRDRKRETTPRLRHVFRRAGGLPGRAEGCCISRSCQSAA